MVGDTLSLGDGGAEQQLPELSTKEVLPELNDKVSAMQVAPDTNDDVSSEPVVVEATDVDMSAKQVVAETADEDMSAKQVVVETADEDLSAKQVVAETRDEDMSAKPGDKHRRPRIAADEATEAEDEVRLHLSTTAFEFWDKDQVEDWVKSVSPSHVPVSRVFKMRKWLYCFVTIKKDHEAAFTEAVNGAFLKKLPVEVKRSNKRVKDWDPTFNPIVKKRQKTKLNPAYQPTIWEIKQKLKTSQSSKMTLLEKTAPLSTFTYEEQLKMKDTYAKTSARSFTKNMKFICEREGWTLPQWATVGRGRFGCQFEDIIPTKQEVIELGYRNKCEFTVGVDADGKLEVGFVARILPAGRQVIGAVADLPHVPTAMKCLLPRLQRVVAESGLPVYDRSVHQGVWRLFTLRMATVGDALSVMVLIQTAGITREQEMKIRNLLEEHVIKPAEQVKSVYIIQNTNLCDAADADAKTSLLCGSEVLQMPLCGLTFELGPKSFFQANSSTCEALYDKAIDWAEPKGLLLDICCGVGTIGIVAAKKTGCRVIGIELVEEACEAARKNARNNNVEIEVHQGKVEDVLGDILNNLSDGEVSAIVDPPRGGLHSNVLMALRNCPAIRRLVYISCNPESLATDVGKLCHPSGLAHEIFKPTRAVAVDMFPHTVHCEMILQLDRLE